MVNQPDPVTMAAQLSTVPGISMAATATLRAVMVIVEKWDAPTPLPGTALAEATGLSDRTVKSHLSELKQAGYIDISRNSKGRIVTLQYDAFVQHIDCFPWGNSTGSNPPLSPPFAPPLHPTQWREMKPVTRPANAACSACLYRILEYKNIRIYIPRILSCSLDGLQIDLNDLIDSAGLENLKPFGQEHSWKFDFTDLAAYLLPDVRNVEYLETMFPGFDAYNRTAEHYTPARRDFFILSVALELACFTDDCFAAPWELSARGDNFDDFWAANQQGIIFACLRNCAIGGMDDCDDLRELRDRIKRTYRPASGTTLLDYTRTVLRNELIKLMSAPQYAEYCYSAFNRSFVQWAQSQGYINYARAYTPAHPQWLCGIWGPDLTMGLANRESRWYQPRFTAPMVLMRTLVGMHHIAGFDYGCDESRFIRAYAMLLQAFNTRPYCDEFAELCQELPYLKHLFDRVKGPRYVCQATANN